MELDDQQAKVAAVVVAAGCGNRMEHRVPKQYLKIQGKPLFIYCLETFEHCKAISEVILVVQQDDVEKTGTILSEWGIHKVKCVVEGGRERQKSVRRGLEALSPCIEIVLVHDGVRPFVALDRIEAVIDQAKKYGAAVLAIPVTDTIKEVKNGSVIQTLRRDALWSVQTPQGFRVDWLRQAYDKADRDKFVGTDDASLVERLGYPVRIIPGIERNIKITSLQDLSIAEWIVKEDTG